MKRGIVPILFLLLIIPMTPTVSDASVTVKISWTSGSTTTVIKTIGPTATTTGNTVAYRLIDCTAPCSQNIGATALGTNVVTIADVSSTQTARVIKTDGSTVDKLEIKGVKITSLAAGTLTIDATTSGEYAATTGGSYPYTAALNGTFLKGAAVPPSCNTTTFCVELKLQALGITVNTSGPTTLATVSVPPINTTGGSFSQTDSANVMCPQPSGSGTCNDQLETVLKVVFDSSTEVLTLPGSGDSFGGNVTAEKDGIFYINQECAGCVPTNNGFLAYGLSADFLATCSGAQCNKTSSKSGSSSFQLQWELSIPQNLVQTSIQLVAVDPGLTTPKCTGAICNAGLTAADNQPTSRAFLLFLPPPIPSSGCSSNNPNCLFLDNLQTLQFDNSSVTTGTSCTAPNTPAGCIQVDGLFIDQNGDGQADPVTFGDCTPNGSFFALVRVFDPRTNLPGSLKIFLGTDPNFFFQKACTLAANTDLISLTDARVEVNLNTTSSSGPLTCIVGTTTTTACFSWADALKNFSNKTVVQSISLEADANVALTSQLVVINSATIASASKSNGPCSASPCVFTPMKATNFQLACSADLLPDPSNIQIAITKVGGTTNLGAVTYIPVSAPSGCNYQVVFTPTGHLSPDNGVTNTYELQFLVNGIAKPTPALLTINQ